MLIATRSGTPAFTRFRTELRRRSCNVSPEYIGSYGLPSTSVNVPRLAAAQAFVHSFLRFSFHRTLSPTSVHPLRASSQVTPAVAGPNPPPSWSPPPPTESSPRQGCPDSIRFSTPH